MDYQVLENEELIVRVLNKGAEISSIQSKKDGTEYIWQADRNYWSRHAPILFPIVGKLKGDQYQLDGETYHMSQHGFARDRDFLVTNHSSDTLAMTLSEDEESLNIYPFKFELTIEYKLIGNCLIVRYFVKNVDEEKPMYFAIGAHPGFNLPLDSQTTFTDYYLEFSPKHPRQFIPVTEEVLLQTDKAVELADSSYTINRELFNQGVLIWETAGNTRVELKSDKTEKAIIFDYSSMPYLGIWSPYPQEAPFVCIEPWCGIADTFDTNGNYAEKLGINKLAPREQFQSSYQMTFK
ncbi:aldose 1-epimerase family protein [Enterococcus sp. HMSC072H05]|uniref:aldose 1-epimerase family protein n=1 Tax=Enterococcus sp. HMSC072H05 TaxID=1715012 RepID=UPI003568A233